MKNWQLLIALEDALRPLVEAASGKIQVAKSLEHARQMLSEAPVRWSLILHLEGYTGHPQSSHGMTYFRIATVIQQRAGLALDRGAAIHRSSAADVAFLERVEQVSGWMRSFKIPDGNGAAPEGFTLEEGDWVETEQTALAKSLSWQLEAALPPFVTNRILTIPT